MKRGAVTARNRLRISYRHDSPQQKCQLGFRRLVPRLVDRLRKSLTSHQGSEGKQDTQTPA